MGNHVPNLDGMTKESLIDWLVDNGDYTHRKIYAQRILPGRPEGYLQIFDTLVQYARVKYIAMVNREVGKIGTAQMMERECERLYRELPEYARW